MPFDLYGKNKVTGKYGDKRSYYKPGHFHQGDDIALALNSPINAYADGEVVKVAYDPNGYGNYLDIKHDNGYVTRYAHANGFNVKKGDKVTEGQVIGKVGSTGRSTGPHLHFEGMKDGKRVNPRELGQYFVLSDTVKPKGINIMANTNTNTTSAEDLENLKNQIAQAQMQRDLKRFELTPEEQALKNQTIAKVMSTLQKEVEVPKEMTIADILKGNSFGDRLEAMAQYTRQPEFQRNLGNLLGTRTFNKQTGRFENTGARLGREAEAHLRADQSKALEEEKIQDMLAGNTLSNFSRLDLANMVDQRDRELAALNLAWNKEKYAQDKEYEQQRLDEAIRHNKEIEDLKRRELEADLAQNGLTVTPDGVVTGGASPINGETGASDLSRVKLTAADRKQLTENKTTLKNIEAGLDSLEKNKNAYNPIGGLFPASVNNLYASMTGKTGDIDTRATIDNITAVYRKWLTGAQMSDKERKAYERFLPAPTDDYKTVKSKLNSMKGSIERSNEALLSNYGISETVTPDSETISVKKDSLGLGL